MRYFIKCSYNGKNYHGWQSQNNAKTVQQTLEKALFYILKQPVALTGAGRTDTGVHALKYFAHFDIETEISDIKNTVFRLNSFLPSDISVQEIFRVNEKAHARFSALERTYKYYVTLEKNPFKIESSYYFYYKTDLHKMNKAAQKLFEYTDFTSFSKLHTDTKTNDCKIYKAEWTQNESELIFEITADRFLRNMVRAIVGTLLNVGTGKISVERFCKIIESKNRSEAGISVPAHALFLCEIKYPEDILFYK